MRSVFSDAVIWLVLLMTAVHAAFTPKVTFSDGGLQEKGIVYFDDTANILILQNGRLRLSQDDGVSFEDVKDMGDSEVIGFRMDEFDKKRAYAFTKSTNQYVTFDQGKSWSKFEIPDMDNVYTWPYIISNAAKPEYVIFETTMCSGPNPRDCTHKFYVTTDAFKSKPIALPLEATFCRFARGTKDSTIGKESSMLCSVDKKNSFGHIMESEILWSDDFFKTSKVISDSLKSAQNTQVNPIIDMRVEEQFISVLIQNDRFNSKSSVSLYVSSDGQTFKETNLNVNVVSGVLTFQKSSKLSIFITVANYASRYALGFRLVTATLYASDSSGLKFRKVLDNVEINSLARVENIEGVWFANVVNKEGLTDGTEPIKSVISFDDGYHWDPLKVNDESCLRNKECSLHLTAIQQYSGEGTYVTGPAPGIIMGIGNIGKGLLTNGEQQTYISRDGGVSWTKAIDSMSLFSFGDQGNIIVAMPLYLKDMSPSNDLYYSLDQGNTFQSIPLEHPSYPISLITTIDGTSTKFFMTGLLGERGNLKLGFYSLDFSEAFDGKKCGDDDMEDVYVRNVLPDGKPLCIYGRVEKFNRRKQDAQCLVNKLYEDVKINEEPCECTGQDFECTDMFKFDETGNCVPDPMRIAQHCSLTGVKDVTLDDLRLINGDTCKNAEEVAKKLITSKKFVCSDYTDNKGGDNNNDLNSPIQTLLTKLQGNVNQYFYLEQAEGINTDNVLVRTDDNVCHISHDGGTTFKRLNTGEEVAAIYLGYVPGQVILVTNKPIIYVSFDAGNSFVEKKVPTKPASRIRTLSFHNTNATTFIWYGSENCNLVGDFCDFTSYLTQDGGETFIEMAKDLVECEFVGSHLENPVNPDLLYCAGYNKSTNKKELVSSSDFFEHGETVYDFITGFGVTGHYVIVALIELERKSLKAKVTVDGSTFADADFPYAFQVSPQLAYTILDSVTNSIFLHVTTNNDLHYEVGSILKSNSNGTLYVLALEGVNRNSVGYVDYERVESLEGVIFANVIESMTDKQKNLQTLITHNDGAEWSFLPPPSVDSEGKKYSCIGQPLRKCALHLHGYTERADFRDTFASSSAIGIFIGIGNVGEKLENKENANTFMSTDAGLTWREIKKGEYMWEYGDRGTILVLVNAHEDTNIVHYSLDEGKTWQDYQFAEEKVHVLDLATVPSDSSRKFLIFAMEGPQGRATLTYSIDFSNIHSRQCTLDLDNPNNDDFDFWTPVHPESTDNCLFGHEAKYLRRAIGHNDCFIGSAPLKEGFKIIRNCSCTRRDFECDFNYYRDNDNTCKLVKGLTPADRKKEMCGKEGAFEYFKPTGYRKLPLSTCTGGKNYASWDMEACPGKEKEFNQHYGKEITGSKLTYLIIIPLLVFIFAVWFVYDKGIRRNGGFKQLGQIRLDEDNDFHPIEENNVDVVVNSVVRGGVYGAAVVIATVRTLGKVGQLLFSGVTNRVLRRGVGRRDYVHVPNFEEEDELFGDFNDNFESEFDHDAVDADIFVDEEPVLQTPTQNPSDNGLFNIEDEEDNKP